MREPYADTMIGVIEHHLYQNLYTKTKHYMKKTLKIVALTLSIILFLTLCTSVIEITLKTNDSGIFTTTLTTLSLYIIFPIFYFTQNFVLSTLISLGIWVAVFFFYKKAIVFS